MGKGMPMDMGLGMSPPDMSQGSPMHMGKGSPLEMGKGSPLEMGKGMPLDMSKGMPLDMGKGPPLDMGSPHQLGGSPPLPPNQFAGSPHQFGGSPPLPPGQSGGSPESLAGLPSHGGSSTPLLDTLLAEPFGPPYEDGAGGRAEAPPSATPDAPGAVEAAEAGTEA